MASPLAYAQSASSLKTLLHPGSPPDRMSLESRLFLCAQALHNAFLSILFYLSVKPPFRWIARSLMARCSSSAVLIWTKGLAGYQDCCKIRWLGSNRWCLYPTVASVSDIRAFPPRSSSWGFLSPFILPRLVSPRHSSRLHIPWMSFHGGFPYGPTCTAERFASLALPRAPVQGSLLNEA